MTPAKIKYLLEVHNVSQSVLAKQINVTPASVNQVIHGERRSKKIATSICKAIRKPINQVFPDYKHAA